MLTLVLLFSAEYVKILLQNHEGVCTMYPNEILFVDKFLSKLLTFGVHNIPFKTESYRNGIRAMHDYYISHADEISDDLDDIELLFICDGEKDFANAIMAENGDEISLKNPSLENATIQKKLEQANLSIADDRLNIPDKFMTEITEAFCKVALVKSVD